MGTFLRTCESNCLPKMNTKSQVWIVCIFFICPPTGTNYAGTSYSLEEEKDLRQNLTLFASKINQVTNDVIHVDDIKNNPDFKELSSTDFNVVENEEENASRPSSTVSSNGKASSLMINGDFRKTKWNFLFIMIFCNAFR